MPKWTAELSFALRLADTADGIARRLFREIGDVAIKADNSVVTEADLEIESALTALLRKHFPQDAVMAEESSSGSPSRVGRLWVIDPIDHTANFARGLEAFGTIIGLVVGGTPVVGVVAMPALSDRWWAAQGHGAYHRGDRIRVSGTRSLQNAHITYSQIAEWDRLGLAPAIIGLNAESRWSFGSGGFLGQMWVAEGKVDVSLDSTGYVWDFAAPKIIVEEAGGRFTDVRGSTDVWQGTAVATNGPIHDLVLDRLGTGRRSVLLG